ncbi:tripartite ATP-independent periplasmic transporter, DctQ component (plasmid) [Antarctobacter heliothermus]|uniref:TRAP transporter small permease protein n=1 Tax=Antarctobacter heliothermus TaxID=74033 RepID=A0A222EAL3_9RHOB|nr:TRAP transporter small permease [Antarctobacter heliothermus]ASP23234.1 tripartite ATP-independent periplasmic transporter, DctQ component [Antarctobacter heliothermus]
MTQLLSLIRKISTGLSVLFYGYMVLAVLVQVLGRYVLPFNVGNAVETAAFAQVWLACIGAGLAMRHGAIFAVDALPAMLPQWAARVVSLLIAAGSLIFLAVLIYGGTILMQHGFFQTSPTLLLPMWPVFAAVPVGMGVMAIEVVARVVERWHDPFGNPFDQADVA